MAAGEHIGRMDRLLATFALLALTLVLLPVRAFGGSEINLQPPLGMASRSVGLVQAGRLARGMRVRETAYLRHVPDYRANGRFYGTWQLVQLVERAARRVAFRAPGAPLGVGELSAPAGGPVAGHRSHQNGRDVDLAFYATDSRGAPVALRRFVEFDAHGHGLGAGRGLRFDDSRNWLLVEKLVSDPVTRAQYIFVANHLRQRLLAHARAVAAPREAIERAATVMFEPRHGHPHANHFHLRVYCAPEDRPTCRDQAPYWAWYPGPVPGGLFRALSRTRRVFE